MTVVDVVRDAVVTTTTGLFSHGPTPLEHTLDHRGDPGLLGPDSISWEVMGDVAVFVGGIRALLVQTSHPEVAAGVDQHSSYRSDPLGRLSRTAVYVTETTYGSTAEVHAAVDQVRRAHAGVHGRSDRDRRYTASAPALAAWVHNVLVDSFLAAYQAYGPRRLTTAEADRFVEEQTRIGVLVGADPLPATARDLSAWIADHPDLAPSAAQRRALSFLTDPPLSLPVRVGYRLLMLAAADTIPWRARRRLGLTVPPGTRTGAVGAVSSLRWALGSSPAWKQALERTDAPLPSGVRFR